jgi:hypothetical protein
MLLHYPMRTNPLTAISDIILRQALSCSLGMQQAIACSLGMQQALSCSLGMQAVNFLYIGHAG